MCYMCVAFVDVRTILWIGWSSTTQLRCSDNYRAITLSSVIGKLFDSFILIKEHNELNSSKLQFSFKSDTSTK